MPAYDGQWWRDVDLTYLDEGILADVQQYSIDWFANRHKPEMAHQLKHGVGDVNTNPRQLMIGKAAEFIFHIEQGLPLENVRKFSLQPDPGWDAALQHHKVDVKGSRMNYKYLYIRQGLTPDDVKAGILVLVGVEPMFDKIDTPVPPWWGVSKGWLRAVEFKKLAVPADYAKGIGGRTVDGRPHLYDGTYFVEQSELHKMEELHEMIDLEVAQ